MRIFKNIIQRFWIWEILSKRFSNLKTLEKDSLKPLIKSARRQSFKTAYSLMEINKIMRSFKISHLSSTKGRFWFRTASFQIKRPLSFLHTLFLMLINRFSISKTQRKFHRLSCLIRWTLREGNSRNMRRTFRSLTALDCWRSLEILRLITEAIT